MAEITDFDSIILDIVENHPEAEWMGRCRDALPGADDGAIMAAIEIFAGGDIIEEPDDG